jgi:hypothetical protein
MSSSGQEPVVFGNGAMRRFELTAALTAGSSANAKLVYWDGNSLEKSSRIQFTVYDEFGIFTGDAPTESPAADGSRGYCVWFADAERWVVIQMEC